MPGGQVLYSVNPWFAHEVAMTYRKGVHVIWCSEIYDPTQAVGTSSTSAIAPSSNPCVLYDRLHQDCRSEDRHSDLIKNYKRVFKRLATEWLSKGEISPEAHDEIIAQLKPGAWRIWRPQLYLIPRRPIEEAGRLHSVSGKNRAAYGPELQILDLMPHEFDIVELIR
jgi:hypothetical protein